MGARPRGIGLCRGETPPGALTYTHGDFLSIAMFIDGDVHRCDENRSPGMSAAMLRGETKAPRSCGRLAFGRRPWKWAISECRGEMII